MSSVTVGTLLVIQRQRSAKLRAKRSHRRDAIRRIKTYRKRLVSEIKEYIQYHLEYVDVHYQNGIRAVPADTCWRTILRSTTVTQIGRLYCKNGKVRANLYSDSAGRLYIEWGMSAVEREVRAGNRWELAWLGRYTTKRLEQLISALRPV